MGFFVGWNSGNLFNAKTVVTVYVLKIVSESDILCPNGNLGDIKNLVSFEREMFEDSSYKCRIKKFYYLCQYHHFEIQVLITINSVHVNYMAITV